MSTPTKVYLFCNWEQRWDQGWIAIAENGVVICGHVSSSRHWGLHDVSPQMHGDDYLEALGPDYEVELIEVPAGETPPPEVMHRNELLAALDMSHEVKR